MNAKLTVMEMVFQMIVTSLMAQASIATAMVFQTHVILQMAAAKIPMTMVFLTNVNHYAIAISTVMVKSVLRIC